MTASRARLLIDARGGGFGHASRAALLAAAFRRAGHDVTLCVSPGSDRHLLPDAQRLIRPRALDPRTLPDADLLLVDTFAEGFGGEWHARTLARYPRRALIARLRVDARPDLHAHYNHIWLPYSAALCEWPALPPNALPIGLLARTRALRACAARACLSVYDPGSRLRPAARCAITRAAAAQRRSVRWLRSLTEGSSVAKLLVIGAGYNTFYELLRAGLDVQFVPLRRRHDNQFLRARRLQRAIDSPAELVDWLARPFAPFCLAKQHFASASSLASLL